MKDWSAEFRTVEEAHEAALSSLDRERQKLTEVTNMIDEESTTVRSKDRSVSMDFDGRGEITAITFHGTKYRTMAPAELSHLLLETIRAGRAQCLQKVADAMGEDFMPGISFADLATGKMDAEDIFQKLVSPFLGDEAADGILGRSQKDTQGGGHNG
jgi:YbaB/EbfC DNA-binding family protein